MNLLENNRPIMVKREKRWLFIAPNGSLNIYIKYILKVADDVPKEPVGTGLVMNPLRVTLRTDLSQINQRSILLKIKINTPTVFNV